MLSDFTDWLLTVLTWLPKKVWEWLMNALASALENISVPSWMASAQDSLNAVPSGVIWFANMLQIPSGIAIVLSALLIRFIIRRIPLIG